jgi:site-specific recombinase XerC
LFIISSPKRSLPVITLKRIHHSGKDRISGDAYAAHLPENGIDIRYIQKFLGHNSSKTTEIYTHVVKTDLLKFKNLFDNSA